MVMMGISFHVGLVIGKQYEVVSYKSEEPEATVFLPSSSECKIGEISVSNNFPKKTQYSCRF